MKMAQPGAENSSRNFIDWTQIDDILLDLDGTLLDLNFDLHFWLEYLPIIYSEKHKVRIEDAKDILLKMLNAEIGTLNWYCLDFWENKLDLDIVQLKRNVSHLIRAHPNVDKFLTQVKLKNKKIYLVTNAHRKTITLKMQATKIEHYFDGIISSHDFGVAKQEQHFWHELTRNIGLKKERTIFFDDSQDVLHAARKFNIGQIIAISKPSSKLDAKEVSGFINIENFSQVMPIDSN
jgi:putative hydrolase of the HAD superfamily|tara:strand:- start:34 stop:738 length:705 start_codon:yes stop_codon:yes gene_type:complete